MRYMAVRIPKNKRKIYELNPDLRTVKEFNLQPAQMWLVAVVADFYSPLRLQGINAVCGDFPIGLDVYNSNEEAIEDKVRELAMEYLSEPYIRNGKVTSLGSKFKHKKIMAIEHAIAHYKKLQGYDQLKVLMGKHSFYKKITQDVYSDYSKWPSWMIKYYDDITTGGKMRELEKMFLEVKRDWPEFFEMNPYDVGTMYEEPDVELTEEMKMEPVPLDELEPEPETTPTDVLNKDDLEEYLELQKRLEQEKKDRGY